MESYLFWGVCLLAAAVLLLVVEVFIPSMGLISLTALVLAIAGIVCLFQESVTWGIVGIAAFLLFGTGGFMFALRMMPHTLIGRRLLYGEDADKHTGEEQDSLPPGTVRGEFDELLGEEGLAVTDMRPVGTIRVGDRKLTATSETSFLSAGTKVRVSSVEGNQVKVRGMGMGERE
ncbi:MAG: NfeD family protein [Pyrinomonadaceae bacterium]|nr:NfeD family protein [Phycisphaerales bacterium]